MKTIHWPRMNANKRYKSNVHLRLFAAIFVLAALALFAQDAIFKVDTKLVIVNVSVKDKNGNPIPNLTKNDFEILEDNVKQSLAVFDFEQLNGEVLAPVAANATPQTLEERVAPRP